MAEKLVLPLIRLESVEVALQCFKQVLKRKWRCLLPYLY